MMDQNQMGPACNCPHHRAMPIFIVLIGLLFLLNALGYIGMHAVAVTWPIIVILAGLQKMMQRRCNCCNRDK
jgi:uncharacterized membrane protein